MQTPPEIREAFAGSGLTLDKLASRARLNLTRSSLCRKMSGKQGISESELLKLARVFGFDVSWDGRRSFTLSKAA
jgi:transcriptional regulator with XRE-family HTH domain